MGNVVALSSYMSSRSAEREIRSGHQTGEVVLFTGVRYERIGKREQTISFGNENTQLKSDSL